MNRFEYHHRDQIRFSYSCFDRLILHGGVQKFQRSFQGGNIVWFLRNHFDGRWVDRALFGEISSGYHDWVKGYAQQAGLDIVEPDKDGRREQLVEPYFQQLGVHAGVAVILKAREKERIAVHWSGGDKIGVQERYVNLYYFYLQDPQCGRMFLRICPYFPFNIRVWLNGHNWLACRMRQEGIAFEQRDNLFVDCAAPGRLQELSDAFAPADVVTPVETWLERLLPFYSTAERQQGLRHQLYLTQVEYCHNLLFEKRAALNRLFDRLMDANRGLGHPDKLAIIYRRPCFRPDTKDGQTVLKMTSQRTPVLSSTFGGTSLKQYVSNGVGLRTESTSYRLQELSLRKHLDNLPKVREVLATANDCGLQVQQDILLSYVDRGQLQELRQPSVSPQGRRVPGLRLDDGRLMAVLQAILCFRYLVGKGSFRTKDVLVDVQKALGQPQYTLGQLRYDLSKLRGKGLVVRLAGSQAYRLTEQGTSLAVLYLKLYQRVYAPLTAAVRDPVPADQQVLQRRRTVLDRLYAAVDQALDRLATHLGLAA
jgi:hypothetical protein